MNRSELIRTLKAEQRAHARLIDDIGGECLSSALLEVQLHKETRAALRPYLHRLSPVELRPDGQAPEEYRENLPSQFKAPAGKGIPIDAAVSEIAAAGVGFSGESWDQLALWLRDHAKTRNDINFELRQAKASCSAEAADQVPEIVARMKKTQRTLDRLEACADRSRAGCPGRVRLQIERNLSRGAAMRRYWRQVRRIEDTRYMGLKDARIAWRAAHRR